MRDRNRTGRGKKRPAATDNKASELREEAQLGPETEKPPAAVEKEPQKDTEPVTADTQDTREAETEDRSTKTSSPPESSSIEKIEPPAAPPPSQPQKSGGGCATTALALLALVVSLGTGGAGYYLWQQLQVGQQQTVQKLEQNLTSRVGEVGTTLQENKQKFASVEEEIATLKSEIEALGKQQQELRTLQHDTTLQELASLNEKITALNSSLDAAEQRLAELTTQQQTIVSHADEANATLQKLASVDEAITALNSKVEEAGNRQQELLSSLRAIRTQAEQELDVWKLTEAEYLLKVATRRLSLEHDISGAAAALEAADKSLAETGDPRWLPVRKTISGALTELDSLPKPDIEGSVVTLASLEKTVDQLPLPKPERHLQSTALDTSTLSQPEDLQSWGGKIWDSVKKLVIIRRGDKPATVALMPPDQAHYLRQNLHLKLESARYALLRNNPKLFKENLRTAEDWVKTHFDTKAAATRGMLESLQKLQKTEFPQALPDISAPLQQLRKLRNHKTPVTPTAPQPKPPEQSSKEPQLPPQQEGEQQETPPPDAEAEGASS